MGLLSAYVAYRSGAKRERRRAITAADQRDDEMNDVCTNCGYRRVQHDDRGRCPRYD